EVDAVPPAAAPGLTAAPPPPPPGRPPSGVTHGSFRATDDGIVWRCASCDTENRLEESLCVVCGTKFAEALREPAPERVDRDPGTAAMISLFFPGAGHAYLGMWPQALARGLISVWVGLMAFFFAAGGRGSATAIGWLYGLIAFGLWVVAAHDAFREASNEPRQVLLEGRRFTFLVLGLLVLLLASLFLTAFAR
nr:hypothetical protein [Actinomycetota bacterium]